MRMRPRAQGFTLIELMIVVAILGILAVVALPRYQSYVYKSKTTEAVGFLSEIKAHQESYRADFGQYCNVSGAAADGTMADISATTNYWPSSDPGSTPAPWGAHAGWAQLGAIPAGGSVLFRYKTVAGPPSTSPTALGYTGNDFWFVSRALGDLDGDDTNVLFESYSHGQGLYIDRASGWE